MSIKAAIFSTTSLVLLAGSASAELTANQVWTDWKEYFGAFGYSVDGQEVMSGNTLEIKDLSMGFPMPEDQGNASIVLESMTFIENGDGTVNVVFPEVMPISFDVISPDGENVKAHIDYLTRDLDMVASGDPSKITYDYTADALSLVLKQIEINGDVLTPDVLKLEFNMSGLSGQSIMSPGDLRVIEQTMRTGAADYVVNFQDPDGSDSVVVNGSIGTLFFEGSTSIPASIDPENMAAAMADGFAVNGSFGYTDSSAEFAFTDGGDTVGGTSSAGSAEITVRMEKDLLQYKGSSKDASFNIMGGEIPLPIVMNMGETAFNLLMPVAKGETPSDFALALTLGDFTTAEELWALVDPGQLLPRDPATISFDLAGKAKMLFDLFDPEQMAAVEDGEAVPAELEALTLKDLRISIAGAELTGTGDFTFDNTDMESYDGMPKPTGFVELALQGGNGLMDKLVQLGLLPEEQAMGARMMMGLFARPGEGEDSLTSKIEITEENHILANGQRIQ